MTMPGRAGRGARLVIRMVSSANTGFTYYTTKNPRKMQHKLKLMKCAFTERYVRSARC